MPPALRIWCSQLDYFRFTTLAAEMENRTLGNFESIRGLEHALTQVGPYAIRSVIRKINTPSQAKKIRSPAQQVL